MHPEENLDLKEAGELLKRTYIGPLAATDIVIRYQNGIVLIERKFNPLGLAVPGGMAERTTLEDNAIKEAKEETGLDIIIADPRPIGVYSDPTNDPRVHIASVAYAATGSGKLEPMANEDAKSARVYTKSEVIDLLKNKNIWAFRHHKDIIQDYLAWAQEKNVW